MHGLKWLANNLNLLKSCLYKPKTTIISKNLSFKYFDQNPAPANNANQPPGLWDPCYLAYTIPLTYIDTPRLKKSCTRCHIKTYPLKKFLFHSKIFLE